MTRILVVSTDIKLLQQIQLVLASENYQIYYASTSLEGYQQFKRLLPEIVIVDYELDSFKNGWELIQYFKSVSNSFTYIMLLNISELHVLYDNKIQIQSTSLLFKPIGKTQLKGLLAFKEFGMHYEKNKKEEYSFTKSELRILDLIQQQMSTKDIAKLLSLSEKTIKNHRYNICKKLDFKDEKTSIYQWLQQYKNSTFY